MASHKPLSNRDWIRILVLLFACSTLQAQQPKLKFSAKSEATPAPSPVATPVATPNSLAIAVTQVGSEAIQLNQRLRGLSDQIVSDKSISQIEQNLNDLKTATDDKSRETEKTMQYEAIFIELEQCYQDWQSVNQELKSLSATVTKNLAALDKELQSLKTDEARWAATMEAVEVDPSQSELLELTNKAIADLTAAITLVEERRARIGAVQNSIAKQDAIVISQIEELRKAMAASQRSLLEADNPPLWKVQFGSQGEESFTHLLRRSYAGDFKRVQAFASSRQKGFILVGLITAGAFVFFIYLRRHLRNKPAGTSATKDEEIFKRPVALSLLVGITATMPLLYDAPEVARGLVYLIGVVPVVRLLKPRLTMPQRYLVITSIFSVLVWQFLILLTQFPLWIKRDLLEILALFLVAWLAWLIHRTRSRQSVGVVAKTAVYVASVLLIIALIANFVGYVGLADLLIQGTLVAGYRAIMLYTVVVVGVLLISFFVRAKAAQRSHLLRNRADRLVRGSAYGLSVIVLLAWIHQTLNLFAIRQDLYEAISSGLNYQIKIGSAAFAPKDIVAFLLILFFGWLIASVMRAILGEEVLPRLKLARGLPNAIATITHYVLLVMIFILALAAGGVELSKFTILTGALGVGLGFGLQNVVNNFVSGLILLFERPVRVGDLLEIATVSGEVTKIGVRSSTVHAIDGSDIIVPNANLISQQVINRTLTGTRRRIVLNIPVAYGNDPSQVRDLLREVVTTCPNVLKAPVPIALFQGFGNTTLNFEVRFWAPRPEVIAELTSDVALRIAAALSEARITLPAPPVTILNDPTKVTTVTTDGSENKLPA